MCGVSSSLRQELFEVIGFTCSLGVSDKEEKLKEEIRLAILAEEIVKSMRTGAVAKEGHAGESGGLRGKAQGSGRDGVVKRARG